MSHIIGRSVDLYSAVFGEFAWHSLVVDPDISKNSQQHYEMVVRYIDQWLPQGPQRLLEVGAYAHSTAYSLSNKYGAEATIFDLSASTLKLGRQLAPSTQEPPDLVCGDFHKLPFNDNYFDLVYIFAALHHASDFELVARELQRVLVPGGLLCLFQEPFEREACFYKFRTNRPYKFTLFEEALDREDILTTVAEPALGSRDEFLFGMIENQNIPLPVMRDVLSESCDILKAMPYYEGKIGFVGRLWLEWGTIYAGDVVELTKKIVEDLQGRFERVLPFYDRTAIGLGFSLPDEKELQKLGKKIATRLSTFSSDQDSEEYKFQIAQLFGGAACWAVRKRGGNSGSSPNKVKFNSIYPLVEGIHSTFSKVLQKVLEGGNGYIPEFDTNHVRELGCLFPEEKWQFAEEENNLFSMMLREESGEIVFPRSSNKCLLLLRINFSFASDNGCPYRIRIEHHECFEYLVFQEEAILYRSIIDLQKRRKVSVSLEWLDSSAKINGLGGLVKIYYAGALPLHCIGVGPS